MIPTGSLDSLALLPGMLAALGAGLLSFLSPCVLPLIPIYLSFISGESAAALKTGTVSRFFILRRSLFFVAGFTFIFVLLAIIFGGGMRFLGSSASLIINRAAGALVIILALNTLFDFIPFLRGEARFDAAKTGTPPGILKAFLLGMAFAAGWTPCIGPVLSGILVFAGQSGNIARAALLLTLYSAGLGIPFILAGLFLDKAQPVLNFFKKHGRAVKIVSGLLLLVFGLMILTGGLQNITVAFLKAGYALEELSQTGPQWFRPLAAFLSRWLTFQGV